MTKQASIPERLRMDHLQGLEATKAEIEQAAHPKTEDVDERDEESWAFSFEYTDGRGKRWVGDFVNKILSIEEHGYVGVLRSRLQGGQPTESIDEDVLQTNMAVAHMSYSLDSKKRPAWATGDGLLKLKDPNVVLALYQKVRSHEDRYFRPGENPGKSEGSSV